MKNIVKEKYANDFIIKLENDGLSNEEIQKVFSFGYTLMRTKTKVVAPVEN